MSLACNPPAPQPKIPFQGPDEIFGDLFHEVQMQRIFDDGKYFVDCTPKSNPKEILTAYEEAIKADDFDLKSFVETHFEMPANPGSAFEADTSLSVSKHIQQLWSVLKREPDQLQRRGSLIPLPYPYIVPGGRFREIYYWDSYFTLLGLKASGERELMVNMVDNFAFLIDTLGFIPNGNRTYYRSRSQPPFFSMMVELLASDRGKEMYAKYLPAMQKEYDFWMSGKDLVDEKRPHYRRVVWVDGVVLNRYWDDRSDPRAESYKEDVEIAEESDRPAEVVYRNLRAGAESGWDFSMRWFRDGKNLHTIRTTELVPVDLNGLMFHLELMLSRGYEASGDQKQAKAYADLATVRKRTMRTLNWDEELNFYTDYDFKAGKSAANPTLAGTFAMYFGIATLGQAEEMVKMIRNDFLKEGGLVTTLTNSGQQWDAPNAWAPLQWMAIQGLRNYDEEQLAAVIKWRWINLNVQVFESSRKLVEKYNVLDLNLEAGGGEYPLQDGFGWTNGVLLDLLSEEAKTPPSPPRRQRTRGNDPAPTNEVETSQNEN